MKIINNFNEGDHFLSVLANQNFTLTEVHPLPTSNDRNNL